MSEPLAEQLLALRELAVAAGQMLLQSMGRVGPIEQKNATEIVTEVDRRVEQMLVAGIQRDFAGDTIVAEESGSTPGATARTWYIDPLDGTTNFAHGHPIFSVSMACAVAAGLVLAAVYAPYLDELYLAYRGGGARLERPRHGTSVPLLQRQPVELTSALLATGFPYVRDEGVDRNTDRVRDFLKASCHGVRRGGSAAVDLVHVAAGKLDGYWETSLRPWDTAAGTLIAREAGAIVSDQAGRQDTLHFENILAAAPGLHGVMREILARSAEESG
jgi:myo-inositol-1(or 4)-monophosphatase